VQSAVQQDADVRRVIPLQLTRERLKTHHNNIITELDMHCVGAQRRSKETPCKGELPKPARDDESHLYDLGVKGNTLGLQARRH
jgi:hypothetical protein